MWWREKLDSALRRLTSVSKLTIIQKHEAKSCYKDLKKKKNQSPFSLHLEAKERLHDLVLE